MTTLADVTCRRCGAPTDRTFCGPCADQQPSLARRALRRGIRAVSNPIRTLLGSRATDAPDPRKIPLTRDEVFDLLKNERRRLVLQYLADADDEVELGTLAEVVAAIQTGTSLSNLDSEQRKRVYVGLHQCHIPKLDEAGLVEVPEERMAPISPTPWTEPARHVDAFVDERTVSEPTGDDLAAALVEQAESDGGGA